MWARKSNRGAGAGAAERRGERGALGLPDVSVGGEGHDRLGVAVREGSRVVSPGGVGVDECLRTTCQSSRWRRMTSAWSMRETMLISREHFGHQSGSALPGILINSRHFLEGIRRAASGRNKPAEPDTTHETRAGGGDHTRNAYLSHFGKRGAALRRKSVHPSFIFFLGCPFPGVMLPTDCLT